MMTFRFDQTHIYRIWNRVKFNRNYSRLNIPMIVIFSITGNDILQERKQQQRGIYFHLTWDWLDYNALQRITFALERYKIRF